MRGLGAGLFWGSVALALHLAVLWVAPLGGGGGGRAGAGGTATVTLAATGPDIAALADSWSVAPAAPATAPARIDRPASPAVSPSLVPASAPPSDPRPAGRPAQPLAATGPALGPPPDARHRNRRRSRCPMRGPHPPCQRRKPLPRRCQPGRPTGCRPPWPWRVPMPTRSARWSTRSARARRRGRRRSTPRRARPIRWPRPVRRVWAAGGGADRRGGAARADRRSAAIPAGHMGRGDSGPGGARAAPPRRRPRIGRGLAYPDGGPSGRVAGGVGLGPSGNAALDRAALDAVRRAGRFPPAPAALDGASHVFDLPVR
ncbi:MAG: TonB family protein [Rhodobacteraceae bacterium]|nr:TonB family protein [Paracoccaceae bacterium]